MRISVHHRGFVITAAGALLLAGGIALAVAGKPAADPPKPRARVAAPKPLDCKVLERQLSRCGPAIAAAFDSGLGARLAKEPAYLREALLRTISAEFVSKVAAPCYAWRGKVKQADALAACLASAAAQAKAAPCKAGAATARCRATRGLARCRAFAKCLALKVRALPRPQGKTKKAQPSKATPSDKKPAADMKAPPAKRPAPPKK